jgi:hypothetical protein
MSDINVEGAARATSSGEAPISVGSPTQTYDYEPQPWTGMLGFGATLAIIIGVLHGIAGLTALLNDDYYVVVSEQLAVSLNYTAWGWAHLLFGVVAIAAGYGIIKRRTWGRILGVVFASLSAIVNFGFLNAQPVWSAIVIAFDIVLIWALTVHGNEVAEGKTKARWSSPYGPS